MRAVVFASGSFRSFRAIQGVILLLLMLTSYLVSDTWSLPCRPRRTGMGPVWALRGTVLTRRDSEVTKKI